MSNHRPLPHANTPCLFPTAAEDGTVGIMYLVSNSAEATAFANAPEDDYIVLLAASMFPTHFTSLQANSHFKGAMIYDDGYTGPISTDYTQPNKNNGLPFANTASWNTVGNGLHWENVESPVFWLNSEDVATVFECYNASNRISNTGENPSYPLCALELNSFMWGASDAETCLRRSWFGLWTRPSAARPS